MIFINIQMDSQTLCAKSNSSLIHRFKQQLKSEENPWQDLTNEQYKGWFILY